MLLRPVAIQADLLGAYVLGIQNILVVKGEEMAYGDHRDAKPVDDLGRWWVRSSAALAEDGKTTMVTVGNWLLDPAHGVDRTDYESDKALIDDEHTETIGWIDTDGCERRATLAVVIFCR